MNRPRSILAVSDLATHRHGRGLTTQDATLGALGADLAPFITVSLYAMHAPVFPPHPHAGFMVATYILPESAIGFVNQDSLGTRNRIPPGALHVTVAGRGVLHEEQPERAGSLARGFQIWIDVPASHREAAPQALHLPATEVPVIARQGVQMRVVLGSAEGLHSPLSLPTPASLLDVGLEPGTTLEHRLPSQDHAFAFVHGGEITAGLHRAAKGQLLRTRADGDLLELTAGAAAARYTLFTGPAWPPPSVQHGPFVAADAAQLDRMMRRYRAGAFGDLAPMGS